MITEPSKTSNKLLANSAKQYIESASWDELVGLIKLIREKFTDSFGAIGFWCCIIKSDTETSMLDTHTWLDSMREKLLLLGTLEEAKGFIHDTYRSQDNEGESNDN